MTNEEIIIMVRKYVYQMDDYLHLQYIQRCNEFLLHPKSDTLDVLELYKSKIRYEAFTEFCADLYKILYAR